MLELELEAGWDGQGCSTNWHVCGLRSGGMPDWVRPQHLLVLLITRMDIGWVGLVHSQKL